MAVDPADIAVARAGTNRFIVVTGAQKDAIEAQGKDITLTHDNLTSFTWTAGSQAVSGAAANLANVGDIIFNEDTWEFYQITQGLTGLLYTIDREYDGPAGATTPATFAFDPSPSTAANVALNEGAVFGADV